MNKLQYKSLLIGSW